MIKKIFIVLIIFILPSNVFAYPNEPDGFRNLKWGDSIETITQLYPIFIEQDIQNHPDGPYAQNYDIYIDDNSLSGLKFQNPISVSFWNNKLYYIYFDFSEDNSISSVMNNEKTLTKHLFSLFDSVKPLVWNGTRPNIYSNTYFWNGETTDILLSSAYNTFIGSQQIPGILYLSLTSSQISREIRNSERNRIAQIAKQGW